MGIRSNSYHSSFRSVGKPREEAVVEQAPFAAVGQPSVVVDRWSPSVVVGQPPEILLLQVDHHLASIVPEPAGRHSAFVAVVPVEIEHPSWFRWFPTKHKEIIFVARPHQKATNCKLNIRCIAVVYHPTLSCQVSWSTRALWCQIRAHCIFCLLPFWHLRTCSCS